ncbi:ATP-dependent helicase [Haliovirga abyssi]|uniref:DNA 3'-5' helicase n=1 Tax=Haliovirga abyssi TaxID=2996794 RepID=A0AAU9DVU3_9FUSO|nr:UvrD-helicase domain-containing protein [Haliovirga abyssi]BDU50341.1 DNA helicase [Haliovirga abyssi]
MSILDGLNEEQRMAAETLDGPVLILAGAGSGKTRTITYRVAHMIKEKNISPYDILAVTFTNKAAKEMRERVESLVGEDSGKIQISTFHAFGVKLLRIYGKHVGYDSNFNIYDSDDQKRVIKSILKKLNMDNDGLKPSAILSKISKLKEEGIFPLEYEKMAIDYYSKKILSIYIEYQKALKENNAFDFSDILVYTNELLNNKEILEKLQNRYKYIMVDEYQDTNKTQYNIITKIAAKNKNLCVVGDEDQSIYGFRGADIRNILNFEKDYKDATVIKLEKNYRSTNIILSTANALIKNNETSRGKNLWTDREGGELISVYEAETAGEEAYHVSNEIKKIVDVVGGYKNIAILYRTNAQSRLFEESFIKAKIPYKIFGGVQFYQRKEIKDIISYLNVVNNTADNFSIRRIINVPSRGIGEKTIKRLEEYREDMNVPLFYAIKNVDNISTITPKARIALKKLYSIFEDLINLSKEETVTDLIDTLLERTKILDTFKLNNEDERVKNIYELRNGIQELEKENGYIGLGDYLENIALSANTDNMDESDDYVKLMTVHNSKGLEFPVIFMVGAEEELFPSLRENTEEELEEERRLCYVAVTRAKDRLYITYSRTRATFGNSSFMRVPSRFIGEMPEKNLNNEKVYMNSNGYKNDSTKVASELNAKIEKNKKKKKKFKGDYAVGDYVIHKKFGEGKVKGIDINRVDIYFPGHGDKKFPTKIASKFLSKS